jgi:hypothetical protein
MAAIRKFSKRESIIAVAVAMVVIAALFYNAVIEPLAIRWHQLEEEIKQKASDLKKSKQLLSKQNGEPDDIESFDYAKDAKSHEEHISDTLKLIEFISRENSCLILSMRPVIADTPGRLKEITVDLDIEAPLGPLSKFLYDIESRTDVIIRINRFTISSAMSQKGTLKCTLSISRILTT